KDLSRDFVSHIYYRGQTVRALSEDFILPTICAVRCHSGHVLLSLSVGLCLFEFVDELSPFRFHGAPSQRAIRADVPKYNDMLLRIPGVKAVEVRARFSVDDPLITDANGLFVLSPTKNGVDFSLLSIRHIRQLGIPFMGHEKGDRRK